MTTAVLRWVTPTKRADGTDLGRVAQIRIFDSASPTPNLAIAAVPGGDVSFRTDVLSPGTHNFTAVTIDTDGRVGEPVKIGSVDVEDVAPMAPPAGISDPAIEVRDADNRIVPPKPAPPQQPAMGAAPARVPMGVKVSPQPVVDAPKKV
jgi:hypothetical protein